MPCYRCGTRETDPVRGPSPWKRGVRGGDHVLVCPVCQADHDWTADLDRCPICGSWRLVRQLGQVSCRSCGTTIAPDDEKRPDPGGGDVASSGRGLAAEVDAALSRMWDRPTGR